MNHLFVLTGGPGGGKTALLDALAERGYRVLSLPVASSKSGWRRSYHLGQTRSLSLRIF